MDICKQKVDLVFYGVELRCDNNYYTYSMEEIGWYQKKQGDFTGQMGNPGLLIYIALYRFHLS
jgi:hypothetical protein